MNRNYACATVLFFLIYLISGVSTAQNINLLGDLEPGQGDGISNYTILTDGNQNYVYFLGNQSFSGVLCRTNAQKGSLEVLKMNDSLYTYDYLEVSGSKVYFESILNGRGLYMYNEQNNKTTLVKKFSPGFIFDIHKLDNERAIVLVAPGFGANPNQLWVSDGTTAGTQLLADSLPLPSIYKTSYFEGNLILTDISTNFPKAPSYITNGTKSGTLKLAEYLQTIYPMKEVTAAISSDNNLIFYGSKDVNGSVSNHTVHLVGGKATRLPSNIDFVEMYNCGANIVLITRFDMYGYNPALNQVTQLRSRDFSEQAYSYDNLVFFSKPAGSDFELWQTDGVKANTKMLASGLGKIDRLFNLVKIGNHVFHLRENAGIFELFDFDLATNSSKRITPLIKKDPVSYIYPMLSHNNKLVFSKDSSSSGLELWSFDPMITGSKQLTDEDQNEVSIHYNHNSDELEINAAFDLEFTTLSIYSLSGQAVAEHKLSVRESAISLNQLTHGNYFAVITDKFFKQYTRRFIK